MIASRSIMLVFAFILASPIVQAHGLSASCKVKETRVEIEVFYDDDTAAVGAKIRVRHQGKEITTGLTDAEGKWSFPKPAHGNYDVSVTHEGHSKTFKFTTASSPVEPSREEATRFPWLRLILGLAIIVALAVGYVQYRRLRHP